MEARRLQPFAFMVLVVGLVLAGCVAPAEEMAPVEDAAAGPVAESVAPQLFEWSGHVLASELDGPSHFRPTEDALWPVQQEGFLFDVQELPDVMEVALDWDGGGEFIIMLHSHKEHGSNAYIEHVTEFTSEGPVCLRVPTEDLTEGEWQVMVHSRGARGVDWTITIGLVGGAGGVVEDDRHGHWLQDGTFEVDEHEGLPCEVLPGLGAA